MEDPLLYYYIIYTCIALKGFQETVSGFVKGRIPAAVCWGILQRTKGCSRAEGCDALFSVFFNVNSTSSKTSTTLAADRVFLLLITSHDDGLTHGFTVSNPE